MDYKDIHIYAACEGMKILLYFSDNSKHTAFVWHFLETGRDALKYKAGHSSCIVKLSSMEVPYNNEQFYQIGRTSLDNTFPNNPILDLNTWQWISKLEPGDECPGIVLLSILFQVVNMRYQGTGIETSS
uniref:Uncharacterized protein n=1 Tax=Octopus bimaculoides TaxID=37653 RepID=A0A0L8HU78_OCTBM